MAYKVTLLPSGHAFDCEPNQEVLVAGLAAGYVLPYSCRVGSCSTCKARIASGKIRYIREPSGLYLSAEQEAEGMALMCVAVAESDLVVEIKELSLASSKPTVVPCRLVRVDRPSPDVAICVFKLPEQEHMRFTAGQYVDFLLEDGRRRSYSMARAGDPGGVVQIEIHVRHTPGGHFTDRLFGGAIRLRTVMRFEGPLGTFYLREESHKPIVMVASGTGFAPVKALCEHAFARKINKERSITLYWGCRTLSDMYMMELPEKWAREQKNFSFVPVLSEPSPKDKWSGRTGLVHRAVMQDFPDLSGYQVYACGAPVMVNAARRDFGAQCGLAPEEFFADAFITEAEKAAASSALPPCFKETAAECGHRI